MEAKAVKPDFGVFERGIYTRPCKGIIASCIAVKLETEMNIFTFFLS